MMNKDELTSYPFNASDLRAVCAGYTDGLVSSAEAVPLDFEPSETHRNAVRRLMDKSLQKAKRHASYRRVAVIAAVFVILCVVVITTNTQANAMFTRWIRQIFPNHVMYWFGREPSDHLYTWQIAWVSDEFELVDSYESAVMRSYHYRSDENEFSISINRIQEGFVMEAPDPDLKSVPTEVIGGEATFYYSDDGKSNNLVWIDNDENVVFSIKGSISYELMMEIAEDMIIENIRFIIDCMPKGFVLEEHSEGYEYAYRIYKKGKKTVRIEFEKAVEYSGEAAYSGLEEYSLAETTINGMKTWLYQDKNGKKVDLVLFNQEEGYTIEVETNIGIEQTKKIAESIHLGQYHYTIGCIPYGFELTEFSNLDEGDVYYVYENGEKMLLIDFLEMDSITYLDLSSVSGEYTLTETEINGHEAVIYQDDRSVVVDVFDADHRIVIDVNANLDLDMTMWIVQSITID